PRDHRGASRRDRAAGGRPGPVWGRPSLGSHPGGDRRAAVDRRHVERSHMSLRLIDEVLHLGLRDPFRIARTDHAAPHGVTTVVVELRDDRYPGIVGVGEGYPDRFYGETPATMAAVFPLLLDAVGEPDASAA